MPRKNYIDKKAYKRQKRELENKTKGFVIRMNKEFGLKKKTSNK